jgi:hypothetical protein
MIGRDRPTAVGSAFDTAPRAPHRFQSAHMAFSKSLAGAGVVRQMRIDVIAPLIGGCDRRDSLVDDADAATARTDFDDAVFG